MVALLKFVFFNIHDWSIAFPKLRYKLSPLFPLQTNHFAIFPHFIQDIIESVFLAIVALAATVLWDAGGVIADDVVGLSKGRTSRSRLAVEIFFSFEEAVSQNDWSYAFSIFYL